MDKKKDEDDSTDDDDNVECWASLIFNRKAIGFDRQAKPSGLNFFIGKIFIKNIIYLSNQADQIVLTAGQFASTWS